MFKNYLLDLRKSYEESCAYSDEECDITRGFYCTVSNGYKKCLCNSSSYYDTREQISRCSINIFSENILKDTNI